MLVQWNVAVNVALIGAGGDAVERYLKVMPFALLGVLVVVAVHLVLVFSRRRATGPRSFWGWWDALVYLGTLVSVVVLGITSLVGVIRFGILDGWWLFIHMVGAGLFTVVLPLLALSWCEANRFEYPAPADNEGEVRPRRFSGLAKAMFWVILASGLVVTGTMLLSMLTLFGTHGLELLLDLHRYAGLALLAAMILHLYATLLPKLGLG